MATNTTKLALTKPDGTDLVDIAVLNANADKIDAASGATICTSTTRPASPWNGQLIFETDTLNVLVYRTSTSSWNIVGGSTVSSNPPANAGSGNFWWDSDNGKLYIYYNDGNTSQWVSALSASSGTPIVGNAAGRDSLYPSPAQGNTVFRNDLGAEETYYAAYNVSTNPGGKSTAGWYQEPTGRVLQTQYGTTTTQVNISSTTKVTTGLSATITPKYANSQIVVIVTSTTFMPAGVRADYAIFRNGVEQAAGTAANVNSSSNVIPISFTHLDAPATTSAITYNLRASTTSSTIETNWAGYRGTIILMEVSV